MWEEIAIDGGERELEVLPTRKSLAAQPSLEQTGAQPHGQQQDRSRFGNRCCRGRDDAKKTIRLVIGAGGEVQLVAASPVDVVADSQSPEAVDGERAAVEGQQLPNECISEEIERVDAPVAEIANQQVARKLPKRRRRDRQAPR